MPQLVSCGKCCTVLYEGEELVALDEIVSTYDGKCPKCSKKLSNIPRKIEVKPFETNQPHPHFRPEKDNSSKKKSWKKNGDLREKTR